MLQLQRKQTSQSTRQVATTSAAASTVPPGLLDDWAEKHRPPSLASMKIHHTKLKALRQWFALVRGSAELGKRLTVPPPVARSLIVRRPRADRPQVLLVYGKSGTGKRTCCEFLAAEAGVDLHAVDVLDASTFAVPRRSASDGVAWRPSASARPAAGERDRRDELLSTHTTREVSDPRHRRRCAVSLPPL